MSVVKARANLTEVEMKVDMSAQKCGVHPRCAHSAFFHCFFPEKNKAPLCGFGLLRVFFIPVNYPNHIGLVLAGVLERSGGRFSASQLLQKEKKIVSHGGPAMAAIWVG